MAILKNKLFNLIILPVFSGILLGLSALPSQVWYIGFIAFIPLLIAAEWTVNVKKPMFFFSIQLLIVTFITFVWIAFWVLRNANLGFIVGSIVVIPFVLFGSPYILFKKRNRKFATVFFIAAWLSAEFIQSYFQLGTPFANIGHNLGASPKLIQWYEYTGAAGGTLWILAVNFALLSFFKTLINNRKRWIMKSSILAGILLIPIIISIFIFNTYKEKGSSSEVLIIHPSTDCRDVKYRINIYELMDIYLGIMLPQLTPNTDYVVLPETAITNAGWVADLNNNLVFDHFNKQTSAYPNLKLVTGAIMYESIPKTDQIKDYQNTPGLNYSKKYGVWYRTFNAALLVEKGASVEMRVKEGLVPYQEYSPLPSLLPRVIPVGIDFQFSKREQNRQVFTSLNREKTAALICYELVYGNKFFKAAREGAEAFFVLLNEGWYTKAPQVPRQFLQLSVIRAIENRRSIAHASNLGISAFINQRGEVIENNESKQPGFLKNEIRLNNKRAFFSLFGNYIGIIALVTTIILIMSEFIKKFNHK